MRQPFILLIVAVCLFSVSARATDIIEVTSQGGIKAWLVEDHKLPLISMHFAFRGGVEQDTVEKQGLAELTMSLLNEGAGDYDSASFQQALADRSIAMNFNAGRDALQGSLKCLKEDASVAFDLLHLALTKPRFEEQAIARMKAAQLSALRAQIGNPGWQARYALFQHLFANHPYGFRHTGSTRTLESLNRADIHDFAVHHLGRDNLVVAVAGDIKPKELARWLDEIFGGLPKHADLRTVTDVNLPRNAATILTTRDGTQTDVLFALPGPKSDTPEWYAAQVANYILGGGGFASRLMKEVRDKHGLTYGISTGLASMDHAALIVGTMATDNNKTAEALDIMRSVMGDFYDDGVSAEEVAGAKDYLVGAIPLALTSTNKISDILVEMQLEHRPINYLDRSRDLLRAVTVDDVNRVIQRWFDPENMALALVGKPDRVTPTQTREMTRD